MYSPDHLWTDEECDLLIAKYPYMKVKHIAALIPRHSLKAIYRKAQMLGLKAYRKEQDYSAFLYANAGRLTVEELCSRMNCSVFTCYARMRKLNISRTYNTYTL